MGICASQENKKWQEKERRFTSAKIDKYLQEERVATSNVCKILLLGSGESGKSTIIKQMKILHLNGYSSEELSTFTPVIIRNIYDSIRNIILAAEKKELAFENTQCKAYSDIIKEKVESAGMSIDLTSETAHMIQTIWDDPTTRKVILQGDFYLMDNAPYFLSQLERISSARYIPTREDILRSRVKSTGITETVFNIDRLQIRMVDVGGQRSERKKWLKCFDGVTSVMFIVALSEYDQVLLEDSSQNRLLESLSVFENVVKNVAFQHSSIIFFMNKIDLFKEKLLRKPLNTYFPDYTGDNEFESASLFLLQKFRDLNINNLPFYSHFTCATDTGQIKMVFSAVKDTLAMISMKDIGII